MHEQFLQPRLRNNQVFINASVLVLSPTDVSIPQDLLEEILNISILRQDCTAVVANFLLEAHGRTRFRNGLCIDLPLRNIHFLSLHASVLGSCCHGMFVLAQVWFWKKFAFEDLFVMVFNRFFNLWGVVKRAVQHASHHGNSWLSKSGFDLALVERLTDVSDTTKLMIVKRFCFFILRVHDMPAQVWSRKMWLSKLGSIPTLQPHFTFSVCERTLSKSSLSSPKP